MPLSGAYDKKVLSSIVCRSGRSVAGKRLADIYEEQAALAETVLRKARREEELGLKSHADVVQTEAELADEPTGKLDSKNGKEVMVTYSQQSISRSGMVLRRNTGSCPALRWER